MLLLVNDAVLISFGPHIKVGPRAVAETPGGTGHQHSRQPQRPFPNRPHLTLDFLDPEHLLDSSSGELGGIPVPSQESAIIEDLLYCFVGKKEIFKKAYLKCVYLVLTVNFERY